MTTTSQDHSTTTTDPAPPPPVSPDPSRFTSTPEYIEKYNKYQADYVRRLKVKYFSQKNFFGENIFDQEIIIEDEVIKTSRWPCTRSFIIPTENLDKEKHTPSSAAEASTTPNDKNLHKSI